MEDTGFLPNSAPERRWSVGADSPVTQPFDALPPAVAARLREAAMRPLDELPPDYGDAHGLWMTVRSRNPFEILLLDSGAPPSAETLLVRFRVLWKFWTQKSAIGRQGSSRMVIRQKYGEGIESYIDNLQWAYDQLSTVDGLAFWRRNVQQQRAQILWARVEDVVDATLADGLLDISETRHLISRAEYAGYEREEFAGALRSVLHARGFESESALQGPTESERLASARWATGVVWARIRAEKAATPPATMYYVEVRATAYGAMAAVQVEELIRARRVNAGDRVCVAGAPVWQMIEHSQFAHHFRAHHVGVSPPACPRCRNALTSASKSILPGVLVVIFGVITTVLYIGFVLIVIGAVMMWSAGLAPRWHCSQCGYKS